jgi:hypothetical protein
MSSKLAWVAQQDPDPKKKKKKRKKQEGGGEKKKKRKSLGSSHCTTHSLGDHCY